MLVRARASIHLQRGLLCRQFYAAETINASTLLRRVRKIQLTDQDIPKAPSLDSHVGPNLVVTGGGKDEKLDKPASSILEQYRLIQRQYPEYIVLMQVGDFLEVFDTLAQKASQILDIGMCNSRYGSQMTGFPLRSMDTYIERLLKEGQSVVLVEQYDVDKAIRRKITRIITPGTITEENLLDGRVNNFILAIEKREATYGLAWIDMSTGYFRLHAVPRDELYDELMRIHPVEIVMKEQDPVISQYRRLQNHVAISVWEETGRVDLEGLFGSHFDLEKYTKDELAAAGRLLNYVMMTQLEKRPYIQMPERFSDISTMRVDSSALKSLEILKNNSTSTRENSLLDVLDVTCTAAGSRLLAQRLASPLLNLDRINERLDKIEYFQKIMPTVDILRDHLRNCKDLERCYQRLALNRNAGGPRDMLAIKQTLELVETIVQVFSACPNGENGEKDSAFADLDYCKDLTREIGNALTDTPSTRPSDGGIIRPGYSQRLDELMASSKVIESKCQELVEKYRRETSTEHYPCRLHDVDHRYTGIEDYEPQDAGVLARSEQDRRRHQARSLCSGQSD